MKSSTAYISKGYESHLNEIRDKALARADMLRANVNRHIADDIQLEKISSELKILSAAVRVMDEHDRELSAFVRKMMHMLTDGVMLTIPHRTAARILAQNLIEECTCYVCKVVHPKS